MENRGKIDYFQVYKMNGEIDIKLNIVDNKMVIVGDNGLGKSTLMSLFYFTISYQWRKLLKYNFESIHLSIDNKIISFTKRELSNNSISQKRGGVFTNKSYFGLSREEMESLTVREINLIEEEMSRRELLDEISIRREVNSKKFTTFQNIIKDRIKYRFIFLPTYRRIEQDLTNLFGSEEREKSFRKNLDIKHHRGIGEVVEFGMADVEEIIKRHTNNIKDKMTNEFSTLTTTYLSDIINGTYKDTNTDILLSVNMDMLDNMLDNIDLKVITENDRIKIKQILENVKLSRDKSRDEGDLIIIHFLSKFINLQAFQENEESTLVNFVKVCNSYLSGKHLSYDSKKYIVKLIKPVGNKNETIKFSDLSSGEKQIVSLFTNVYLENQDDNFFMIIDEPELSISVPWQKRLLPDIWDSGRCVGLFAVTHSPFIFANSFDSYAVDMKRFISG